MKLSPFEISQSLKPWNFIVFWLLSASLIYLYLSTLAQTPRSSMNVMQGIGVMFFFIVFIRQCGKVKSEFSTDENKSITSPGMIPALVLGFIVWSFCVPNYFISDDFAHIYHAQAPMLKNIWEMLIQGQAETFMRPLGFASIYLDYRIWHQWAPGYHIINLLIHLSGVAGLYLLCRALNLKGATASTASLIFAVLPINAETIIWLGARFDLLSTTLSIWALVFYLKFRNTNRGWFYIWAMVCFSFAVFSKETAYIVPLLLLSMEYLVFSDRQFKPLSGFFCAAVVFFIYRWIALGGIGGYQNLQGAPATYDIGFKLLEGLFIRTPAQSLLGFNWSEPLFPVIGILASLAASILLLIAFISRRRSIRLKHLLFCLVWILLSALPAHPLLLIGPALSNSRVLYLGSVGAAIFLALLLSGIENLHLRNLAPRILIVLFCIAAFFNMAAWRWTSNLSQRFLAEVSQLEPSPPPNAVYIFHNMPLSVRGVFYFQAGLQEAVRITYNRSDLKALRKEDPFLKKVTGTNSGPVIHWEWRRDGKLLLTRISQEDSQ